MVEVLARDAHKVAEALAAGGADPDFQVWLPDSDLWPERVPSGAAEGLGEGIPVSPSDSVASSPVALAEVPSASRALGRFPPNDEIGLWEFATTLDGEKDHRRPMPTKRLGDPATGGGTHRERPTAAFAGLRPVPGGAAATR
ncbi:hypothetical protein [Streptomyces sp. NPDC048142]|uniref:hypothetical protein n=1 Tax=Streptomyces sp. NPDC048142 TaxID=3365501 RepID=UPI00371F6242